MTCIIRTNNLIYMLTPSIDVVWCRCCQKPFGTLDEAWACVPDEFLEELKEIARVRLCQIAGSK